MTVKDICIVTGLSERTVRDKIKELYPERCVKGKATFLNQGQAEKVVGELRKKGFISKHEENSQVISKHEENSQVDAKGSENCEVETKGGNICQVETKGGNICQVETKGDSTQIVEFLAALFQENKMINSRLITVLDNISHRIDMLELKNTVPQIEMRQDYYSILGYCRFRNREVTWSEAVNFGKCAKKISKELGFEVKRIPDERYGYVGSYHINILDKVFEM
jgi:hypothetical protein